MIALVDRLVYAERVVDQCIWLEAAAAPVESCEHQHRIALAQHAASTPPSTSRLVIAINSSALSYAPLAARLKALPDARQHASR